MSCSTCGSDAKIHSCIMHLTDRLSALQKKLDAVDDVLVVNWIAPPKDRDYRKALHDLVTWNIQIENDPLVSESAAKRKAYVERLESSILNQCADNLCWIVDPKHAATLPEAEFLESCRRYRNQMTEANGQLKAQTMTIAQLEARLLELEKAVITCGLCNGAGYAGVIPPRVPCPRCKGTGQEP